MLNKKHSDFPTYQKKWKKLMDDYQKVQENTPLSMRSERDGGLLAEEQKRLAEKIKKLQREYKHLFS